jgi:NADH:ubiquinone oxidoreductase subunit F (NADH-binding)
MKLFRISSCIEHLCIVEDTMGVSLRDLIEKQFRDTVKAKIASSTSASRIGSPTSIPSV